MSKIIFTTIKKMNKIEHIGIAVKDLAVSIPIYETMLGITCIKIEEVASEQVKTAFFIVGPNKIELLQSTTADGVIARFIEERGEGIHHIAYEVNDIEGEMKRLVQEGFTLLNDKPKLGADNKMICFVHPKGTNGVLTELCMEVTTLKK
jgi:methylmalonyl-CoA/ethylmalonyl-CoA epimerase